VAVAAVTPRVRTIVICDEVLASPIEDGVFTLEGVRQHLQAELFPWPSSLSLFLLLSCPRKGKYPGKILIVNERNDKPIRYVKFLATFEQNNELLPLNIEIDHCVFPEAGQYVFEIYFSLPHGGEALKGEHPFTIFSNQE
jgi:hypothetical protein